MYMYNVYCNRQIKKKNNVLIIILKICTIFYFLIIYHEWGSEKYLIQGPNIVCGVSPHILTRRGV